MSQINLPAPQTTSLSPLAPASAPSETPAPSAPAPGPLTPGLTADRNQVKAPQSRSLDLGPLPWDPSADAPRAPEARFTETPEFQGLAPKEQATLRSLFETATEGAKPMATMRIAGQIAELLKQDKLTAQDAFGEGILDHLATFNATPLHDKLAESTSKGQFARELIQALANPESLGQGEGTYACAEATLSATLAHAQPADYARIAVGLATQGEARIPGPPQGPNPDTVKLNMMGEAAGRSTLEFMMQRSFKGSVDERSAIWLKIKDFFGFEDDDKGLNAKEVKLLYDGIVGKDHVTIYADPGVNLLPAIAHVLKNASNGAIKATLQADEGLHSVAVTGVSEQGVTIWDPATRRSEVLSKEQFNDLLVRATFDREEILAPSRDRTLRSVQHQIRNADGESAVQGMIAEQEEGGGRLGGRGQKG